MNFNSLTEIIFLKKAFREKVILLVASGGVGWHQQQERRKYFGEIP